MKLSIITVCKNAAPSIATAVRSVVSQTYPDIEYVVVDGQSSDRTLEILAPYRDRITTLIHEPDDGIYAAMNKGIRHATGEFVYFLNADDALFDPTVIADVMAFIAQQTRCDFVYGDLHICRSGNSLRIRKPKPPEALAEALMLFLDGPQHPASFFKRDLFHQLGGFEEHYRIAADYAWFLKLLEHQDLAVHYIPRTIASFSLGGVSSQDQRRSLQEVFAAQNQAPFYQQELWKQQRIECLQAYIIALNEQWQAAVQAQVGMPPPTAKNPVWMAIAHYIPAPVKPWIKRFIQPWMKLFIK
ncbi:glycosyltransferase family 2 protein [Leptolyngbya sp. AN02str]|uniref:glycosyltransferase family 2 protein n=1 Tax=Leptolyngbya sp. AN02str TaxID=3423363 RepID=UPI003D319F51